MGRCDLLREARKNRTLVFSDWALPLQLLAFIGVARVVIWVGVGLLLWGAKDLEGQVLWQCSRQRWAAHTGISLSCRGFI